MCQNTKDTRLPRLKIKIIIVYSVFVEIIYRTISFRMSFVLPIVVRSYHTPLVVVNTIINVFDLPTDYHLDT